jgi:hypothetical protein
MAGTEYLRLACEGVWYLSGAPDMQDKTFDSPRNRAASRAALAGATWLLAAALLAGCSSTGDNPLTVFADPGKYRYHSCEQIVGQQKFWSNRQTELKMLMDKADQSAGGAVVNVLAYKADAVAASEELKVLENTARAKNCETPSTWKSNSTIR